MLKLGVWIVLQNVVKMMHSKKRKEADALHGMVKDAWEKLDPVKHEKMVLDLIIEEEGGNSKVESKQDRLYREPSPETE